jgi:hypothetical protein
MNIYKQMQLISNEIQSVTKNLSVGYGGSSYKAVADLDVINAVKPLEEKHGVFSYPFARKIIEQQIIEGEKHDKMYVRIETTYRFVSLKDDSFIDVTSYGDGIDIGDKAPGKAMTYADKYALLKAYKIPTTNDDPDREVSEPFKKKVDEPKNLGQIKLLKEQTKDVEPSLLKSTLLSRYQVETLDELNQWQTSEMLAKMSTKKEIKEKI